MSPRRKKPRAHANHERWLVSYADFITLLFAFFVVLYASSQVDKRKVGQIALAIQIAFQEMGVFPASTTQVPLDNNEPMPFSTVQAIQNVKHNAELRRIASAPEESLAGIAEETDIATLQAELKEHSRSKTREATLVDGHTRSVGPKNDSASQEAKRQLKAWKEYQRELSIAARRQRYAQQGSFFYALSRALGLSTQ